MKVKSIPEDFVVNEVADIEPGQSGPYSLYLLEKKGWNTPDLLKRIAARAGISYSLFSYGGRKDRHAHTFQHIAVKSKTDLTTVAGGYRFTRVGFVQRPMGPDLIRGNQFKITLRSLSDEETSSIRRNAAEAGEMGFPNYFDDQRFGSMDPERGFIAERILKGQWRGSVEIYLTSSRLDDPREVRDLRHRMRENWGDWGAMLDAAHDGASPVEIAMLRLLVQEPGGYVKALRLIPGEDLSLFFSAYQAHLWNEVVRRVIVRAVVEPAIYPGLAGPYLFYQGLAEKDVHYLTGLSIPLPAANARFEDDGIKEIYLGVLEERGIHPGRFNVRKLRQAFFKPTPRQVVVYPRDLRVGDAAPDELNAGRLRVELSFFLPRGSYGTMLVKRLSLQTEGFA